MLLPFIPDHSPLHPELILRRNCTPWFPARICVVLRLCNGKRTVRQVVQEVPLPAPLTRLILRVALKIGALEVATGQPPIHTEREFFQQLHLLLNCALGPAGECLLERANLMTRRHTGTLTPQDAAHLLIALELVASDWERQQLLPQLDDLRDRYAA